MSIGPKVVKLTNNIYKIDAMLDLPQNSPPKVKIPTLPIIVDQKYEPPNKNSSTEYIVYAYVPF